MNRQQSSHSTAERMSAFVSKMGAALWKAAQHLLQPLSLSFLFGVTGMNTLIFLELYTGKIIYRRQSDQHSTWHVSSTRYTIISG